MEEKKDLVEKKINLIEEKMKEEYKVYYEMLLKNNGIEAESRLCIEEMSELIKELCKLERYRGTEKEYSILMNVKEEIADVLNTVEQLYLYYGPEEIENIRLEKFKRAFAKKENKN